MAFKELTIFEKTDVTKVVNFNYVKELDVVKDYRSASIYTALDGSLKADIVGNIKTRINARILLCTKEELDFLTTHKNDIVMVQYCEGTMSVVKQCLIASEIQYNSPLYAYGEKNKGVYYPNVEIELEEV